MSALAVLSDGSIDCVPASCLLRPWPNAKAAMLVRGAAHPAGCGEVSVIVSAEPARHLCPWPWPALVDRFTVWRNGATAIWLAGDRAEVLTDRAWRGTRPWVPPPPIPRARVVPKLPAASTDAPAQAE